VIQACSRRIVGWSVDTVQDPQLAINALHMAIRQRNVRTGNIVHVDHRVQSVHVVVLY